MNELKADWTQHTEDEWIGKLSQRNNPKCSPETNRNNERTIKRHGK